MTKSHTTSFQPKCRVIAAFHLSAMTDIVFILLVFFLVTTTLAPSQGLPVELPKSSHATPRASEVCVTLTDSGQYYLNETEVSWPTLTKQLRRLLCKDKPILIQADQKLPLARVVAVANLAAAQQAQIALATLPEG